MEDERGTASPDDAGQLEGQSDAGYQPPPPPRWSAPAAPPAERKRGGGRMALSVAATVVVVAGVAVGTVAATRGEEPAAPAAAAAAKPGYDLREGAVFVASNDAAANKIVALARSADGKLKEIGRYDTGGTGTGSFEDSAKALVLGTVKAESSPTQLVDKAEYLYAANGGDDTITVFKVLADRLEVVTRVPSGGQKPVSLTVSNGLLYALNSGEEDDRLLVGPPELGPAAFIENCTTGQVPSVTGFRIGAGGTLAQIPASTRVLGSGADSGCSQAQLTPDGKTLVVSERRQAKKTADGTYKGGYVVFPVRADGTLGPLTKAVPSGNGPFGFTFLKDGTLLGTEQNGPLPDAAQLSSYTLGADGTLTANGPTVQTLGSDTCWVVVDEKRGLAFASSVMGGGAISSFRIGKDGRATLMHKAASAADGSSSDKDGAPDGLTDLTLSRDGKYLYQLNSIFGELYVYQVSSNGTLTEIERHPLFRLQLPFEGGQLTPYGLVSF